MCIGFLIIDIADGAGTQWYACLSEPFQQLTAVLQSRLIADAASGPNVKLRNKCRAAVTPSSE